MTEVIGLIMLEKRGKGIEYALRYVVVDHWIDNGFIRF